LRPLESRPEPPLTLGSRLTHPFQLGLPCLTDREDISANLGALEQLQKDFGCEMLLVESGGDNLAANYSRELADYIIYVVRPAPLYAVLPARFRSELLTCGSRFCSDRRLWRGQDPAQGRSWHQSVGFAHRQQGAISRIVFRLLCGLSSAPNFLRDFLTLLLSFLLDRPRTPRRCLARGDEARRRLDARQRPDLVYVDPERRRNRCRRRAHPERMEGCHGWWRRRQGEGKRGRCLRGSLTLQSSYGGAGWSSE
jgi:hypothetical protein